MSVPSGFAGGVIARVVGELEDGATEVVEVDDEVEMEGFFFLLLCDCSFWTVLLFPIV
jgi:hypothetical protein